LLRSKTNAYLKENRPPIFKFVVKNTDFTKFRRQLRKEYVIKSLRRGYIIIDGVKYKLNVKNYYDLIFEKVFNKITARPINSIAYFQEILFPGMSGEQIYIISMQMGKIYLSKILYNNREN